MVAVVAKNSLPDPFSIGGQKTSRFKPQDASNAPERLTIFLGGAS